MAAHDTASVSSGDLNPGPHTYVASTYPLSYLVYLEVLMKDFRVCVKSSECSQEASHFKYLFCFNYVQARVSLCGYGCVSAGTHLQRPEILTPLELAGVSGGLLATGMDTGS